MKKLASLTYVRSAEHLLRVSLNTSAALGHLFIQCHRQEEQQR